METVKALRKAIKVLEVRAAEYFSLVEEAEANYEIAEKEGNSSMRKMVELAGNADHYKNEYESNIEAKKALEKLLEAIESN